jgi:hypothetical protein
MYLSTQNLILKAIDTNHTKRLTDFLYAVRSRNGYLSIRTVEIIMIILSSSMYQHTINLKHLIPTTETSLPLRGRLIPSNFFSLYLVFLLLSESADLVLTKTFDKFFFSFLGVLVIFDLNSKFSYVCLTQLNRQGFCLSLRSDREKKIRGSVPGYFCSFDDCSLR